MHQTRAETSKKLPIPRKGTKYVVRASGSIKNSVPVLIALRDILKIAKTTREVKKLINQKVVKINGREVKDYHESIHLFNLLELEKTYILTLSKSAKFVFEQTNIKERPCKIIGKKILKKGLIQLNLHDGYNILSKENIPIDDTIYLDYSSKVTKHIKFEKGKKCLVIKGKYTGHHGVIKEIKNKRCLVNLEDRDAELNKKEVFLL